MKDEATYLGTVRRVIGATVYATLSSDQPPSQLANRSSHEFSKAAPKIGECELDCDRQIENVPANLLDRQFVAERPNQKWIADFTYIWTAEGWLYVSAVIDLFSRRVVGWSFAAMIYLAAAVINSR